MKDYKKEIREILEGLTEICGSANIEPRIEDIINIVENRLPKWNKVKEKLPDINQTVWLTNGKDWVTLGCLVNYDGKLMWSCNNYVYVYSKDYQTAINYNIDFSEIIYWYPVPDLPYTK